MCLNSSDFFMNFEESQDYISKRGFDIPWNDCDVFVDEREIDRTVGNVLKWADNDMVEKFQDWLFATFYEDEHDGDYDYGKPYIVCKFDTFEDMLKDLSKKMNVN